MNKQDKNNKKKELSLGSKRLMRLTCFLNEQEYQFIDNYLEKNKITNKSRWLRETVLLSIYKEMDENYPTLFDEHEMRR
ncbi:MAG: hypothetical protein PHQ88_07415 [Bacteroides sp.]|nr:hypothetical protein [Bacteroides sp.]MDD2645953.1 hypothetical protein [Bacteroides sp.]MDD4055202.1 hypothetical protein [Bacteroides sp.]MDD4720667.1 hypothetical protein [Bacteroides sp.]NLI63861.1 hypothetical protein [Bacteroidales bacterium]